MFDLRARNTCGAGVTLKGGKHVQTQGRCRLLALIANLWAELAREDQVGRILKTSRGADFNLRC